MPKSLKMPVKKSASAQVYIGTIGSKKMLFNATDGVTVKVLTEDDSPAAIAKENKWTIIARKDVKPSLVKQLLKKWAIARNGSKPAPKAKAK